MPAARPAVLAAAVLAAAGAAVWAQPPPLARLLARQHRVVVHVPTAVRALAITVDDGPDPALTPRLLEVLGAHAARATFFVLGSRVEAHPAVVRAVAEAGHEVGNHGWDDAAAVLSSGHAFRRDLERTHEAVLRATGARPVLYRPGSGWVRPGQLRDAAELGYTTVLGSVAVRDDEVRDVERAVRFVLRRVRPGSVLVLHEGLASRAGVVPLLERLLPELARRGYRTATVSELLTSAQRDPTAQRSIS
ncbi:polysaccharide deacetylase family protein [Oryzobacter telluris]|uniref:polysaccharide deacetylase family protein n=1 Tax=Oryzobacter telluris TaxID=3149179 RepID=UPI00370D00B4